MRPVLFLRHGLAQQQARGWEPLGAAMSPSPSRWQLRVQEFSAQPRRHSALPLSLLLHIRLGLKRLIFQYLGFTFCSRG